MLLSSQANASGYGAAEREKGLESAAVCRQNRTLH